eukprot:10328268-Prorocentrum_lima.AAC.1
MQGDLNRIDGAALRRFAATSKFGVRHAQTAGTFEAVAAVDLLAAYYKLSARLLTICGRPATDFEESAKEVGHSRFQQWQLCVQRAEVACQDRIPQAARDAARGTRKICTSMSREGGNHAFPLTCEGQQPRGPGGEVVVRPRVP